MPVPTQLEQRGASHHPVRQSLLAKVPIVFRMLVRLPRIAILSLREVVTQRAYSSRTIKRIVLRNTAKALGGLNSIEVSQALDPVTGDTISNFCRAHLVRHNVITLKPKNFPAARLYALQADASSPDGVLLYFHGGGYIRAAVAGQVELALLLARSLHCRDLYLLEYTLAPGGRYPTQLAQGVAALQHLLHHDAVDPARIFIGGDSAGGNLSLALLAHLKQPHPDISPIVTNSSTATTMEDPPLTLAGTLCISPRCSNSTTAASFATNAPKDVLSAQTAQYFLNLWQPKREVWAEANVGGADFWDREGLPTRSILLVAGGDECYVDDIRAFAEMIHASEDESPGADGEGGERRLIVVEGAMHDQTVLDFVLGIEDGSMTGAIVEWAGRNALARP